MKRIVVDYKIPWLYPRAGIAGFFNPLLRELLQRHPDCEFLLVAPGPFASPAPEHANCTAHSLAGLGSLSRLQYLRYSLLDFPAFLARSGADLLFSPYYDFRTPEAFRGRTVLTVHDLCFLDLPGLYPFWTRWLHRWLLDWNLSRAGAVVTVSSFSRARLLERFPLQFLGREPEIVYNSFAPGPIPDGEEDQGKLQALAGKLGIAPDERVVLYTGGIDVRKNVEGLLAGFAQLLRRSSALLLITGKVADRTGFQRQLQAFGLQGRAVLTGPLEEAEMQLLCRRLAHCGISVSRYEGFGRSAIEAATHGLPFVSSPLAVVREMVGEYPLYCDPQSPEDIAAKLEQALSTPRPGPAFPADPRFSLSRNAALLSGIMQGVAHGR